MACWGAARVLWSLQVEWSCASSRPSCRKEQSSIGRPWCNDEAAETVAHCPKEKPLFSPHNRTIMKTSWDYTPVFLIPNTRKYTSTNYTTLASYKIYPTKYFKHAFFSETSSLHSLMKPCFLSDPPLMPHRHEDFHLYFAAKRAEAGWIMSRHTHC